LIASPLLARLQSSLGLIKRDANLETASQNSTCEIILSTAVETSIAKIVFKYILLIPSLCIIEQRFPTSFTYGTLAGA